VRVNKKSAVALADMLDEKIDEQGRLAHAAHARNIYVFRGVNRELVARNRIASNRNIHADSGKVAECSMLSIFLGSSKRRKSIWLRITFL
jgi:hypothetical protein